MAGNSTPDMSIYLYDYLCQFLFLSDNSTPDMSIYLYDYLCHFLFLSGNSTPDMSICLYDYLCHTIVGSEDYVRLIRLMNASKDRYFRSKFELHITSGSFGEGLELKGSDQDIMRVIHDLEVTGNGQMKLKDYHSDKNYFIADTDDIKPGFAYLHLMKGNTINKHFLYRSLEGKLFLSSALIKQNFIDEHISVVHGPCISDKEGNFDIAVTIHSKLWITTALKWITRSNKSWPTSEVKQRVIDHGVLAQFKVDLFFNDIVKIVKSKTLLTYQPIGIVDYVRALQLLLSSQTKKLRSIYKLNVTQTCYRIAQIMQLSSLRGNKHNYKQYIQCLCYILQSTHHDAVSGLLMLASLFYKKKQYNKALYVLSYSLRKCFTDELYYNANVFRKLGKIRMLRILLISTVEFSQESSLIPGEIKLDAYHLAFVLPPVVYLHFLTFLCHYHLNNIRNYQKSLGVLRLTIEENYCIFGYMDKAAAYDCLGVAFLVVGDKESAREACLKSIQIFPDQVMNPSFKRLGMIDLM
ncbi:unnamed protein product [Mytilus coruscus]|uniref:Mab-21-like HhH/H2TH-like domain-containing protein n=1 Tax=Mytilus coruscus TaxID=42192 RepID=A0A6J8CWF3_MYTCO|nr:unnamed protein product [Mytilus coruscus]